MTSTTTQPALTRPALSPLSGRRIAGWFVAFFGLIIVVNVTMAVLAVRTAPGVVDDNAYLNGLAYNKVLAAADAQARTGWRDMLSIDQDNLTVLLVDREGRNLPGLQVTVQAKRPSHDDQDQTLSLMDQGNGRYHVPVNLAPGPWQIDVHVTDKRGQLYHMQHRVQR